MLDLALALGLIVLGWHATPLTVFVNWVAGFVRNRTCCESRRTPVSHETSYPEVVNDLGWHALSLRRACSSALCHALRRASERAIPKLNCAEALVWFCGLMLSASIASAEYPPDERPYIAKGYAWENNTLGMDERVPAPWTPLRYEGDSVECWGRRFTFGSGALPTQISSQKLDLFAMAPKIEWRVDGRDVITNAGGKIEHPVAAGHKSVRTWESKAGAHQVSVTASLEYDGFMHVSLRLVPQGKATIERLVLHFTMPRTQATLMNRFEEYDFELQHVNHDNVLGTASQIARPISMGFNPSVWIGNHEVGLEWSCESNAGWSPMKSTDAIQIVHGKDLTRLTVNCITIPRQIDGPFELSFALVPTPTKPRPVDWRRLRLTTAMNETAGYRKRRSSFRLCDGVAGEVSRTAGDGAEH